MEILNRAYEDILEMNMNSNKNASASIDDEQKFQVVCSIFCFYIEKNSNEIFSFFSFKISVMQYL